MKFGTGADAVNAVSFKIQRGQLQTGNAQEDRYKILTHVDKSTETLDYGARLKRLSTIKLVEIDKDDYITLINYLDTKHGSKVQIEEEYSNEKLFTPSVINSTPDTYFAYITGYEPHGEISFSSSRRRFECTVSLSFAGANSGDEINTADSQLIDVLLEWDTKSPAPGKTLFEQSGQPTANAVGDRWFDTDDNKLYEWNGSQWDFLYDVYNDDATYGFVNGVFYLSAFADLSQDLASSPDTIPQNYVSGWIYQGSISIQGKSIDLNKGPSLARKTGFQWGIDNTGPLWSFLNDNNIPAHGGKATLKFYKKSGSNINIDIVSTGYVNQPQFDYDKMVFEAEPFRLNDEGKFPIDTIDESNSRYINVRSDEVGKPVIRSYGFFPPDKPGLLQNISTESLELTVTAFDGSDTGTGQSRPDTVISAAVNRLNTVQILINESDDLNILHYTIDSTDLQDINSSTDLYALTVLSDDQTGTQNPGTVRKILSIDDGILHPGFYTITIDAALPTIPDTNGSGIAPDTDKKLNIQISQSSFKFQTGDAQSGGFGDQNVDGVFQEKIRVFQLSENERQIEEIQAGGWSTGLGAPYNGNLLALNPRNVVDPSSLDTYQSSKSLKIRPFGYNPAPLIGDANSEIDFQSQLGISLPAQFSQNHTRHTETPVGQENPFVWTANIDFSGTLTYSTYTNLYVVKEENKNIVDGINRDVITEIFFLQKFILNSSFEHFNEGTSIIALRWSRNPSSESEYLNNDDVRLVLNMRIESFLSYNFNANSRHTNTGIKLILRFKKNDGSYITDPSWTKDISPEEMGVHISSSPGSHGAILINNNPNGTDVSDGFFDGETALSSNYDHQIQFLVADVAARNALFSLNLVNGDKIWITDNGSGISEIQQWDGSTWNSITPNIGDLIYDRESSDVYKVASGPSLVAAIDGVDFNSLPVLAGKGLFDLSSLFGPTPQWSSVQDMELLIVIPDLTTNQYAVEDSGVVNRNYYMSFVIQFNEWPHLFWKENIASTDRPLFASFRGKNLPESPGTAYAETPFAITKDLMEDMYPGVWDESSLISVTNSPIRSDWVWRAQFIDRVSSEDVLEEIARNLWSSVIHDKNDKLKFVSMFRDDHPQGSPSKTFTDAEILEDSWSVVEYRKIDDIFQKFIFGYDYAPSSSRSNSIQAYREVIYSHTEGPLQVECLRSKWITNLNNVYRENFRFHYDLPGAGLRELFNRVADHFLWNAWRIKFKVSLENVLGGSSLQLCDYIAINSFFHTQDTSVEGWVESLNPNVYDGWVEVGIFIPRPPGVFGPLCDPFNDALRAGIRDISSWTDANGKRNDAGISLVSPRSFSGAIKDAGTSPRTITC